MFGVKKLNFRSYITISVVSHLLLISLISLMPSHTRMPVSVFDIDIVSPFEKNAPLPDKKEAKEIEKQVPLIIKKKPVLLKREKRRQPDKDIIPDIMHKDTDTVVHEKKSLKKKKEFSKQVKPDPLKEANDISSSIKKEVGPLPTGKEGLQIIPGSSLFDKKVIEQIARKNPPANKGITFDTSEFKHRGYMRLLKERIQSIWKYPKEAEELGISGDLYIKFAIKRNGDLGKIEIIRTSGYRHLDKAVLEALKDAQPFWPLPDGWENDDLEITGHFIYMYGNKYIM